MELYPLLEPSVARFQIEEQPQQQVSTQGSLAKLEATLSPKTKAILELRQLLSQMNSGLQELETEIGQIKK